MTGQSRRVVEHHFLNWHQLLCKSPYASLPGWPIKSRLLKSKHLLSIYHSHENRFVKNNLSFANIEHVLPEKWSFCLNGTLISNSILPTTWNNIFHLECFSCDFFFLSHSVPSSHVCLIVLTSAVIGHNTLNFGEEGQEACCLPILSWATLRKTTLKQSIQLWETRLLRFKS